MDVSGRHHLSETRAGYFVFASCSLWDLVARGAGAAETRDPARLIGLNIPWRRGLFFIFPFESSPIVNSISVRAGTLCRRTIECVLCATCERVLSHVLGSLDSAHHSHGRVGEESVYHVSWYTKLRKITKNISRLTGGEKSIGFKLLQILGDHKLYYTEDRISAHVRTQSHRMPRRCARANDSARNPRCAISTRICCVPTPQCQ